MLERCVNSWPSKHPHLYQEQCLTTYKMFLDYLSDSVSNGKKVLDRLKVKGSGFVRETVEQGFLKSQVRRVERLEDVRF